MHGDPAEALALDDEQDGSGGGGVDQGAGGGRQVDPVVECGRGVRADGVAPCRTGEDTQAGVTGGCSTGLREGQADPAVAAAARATALHTGSPGDSVSRVPRCGGEARRSIGIRFWASQTRPAPSAGRHARSPRDRHRVARRETSAPATPNHPRSRHPAVRSPGDRRPIRPARLVGTSSHNTPSHAPKSSSANLVSTRWSPSAAATHRHRVDGLVQTVPPSGASRRARSATSAWSATGRSMRP